MTHSTKRRILAGLLALIFIIFLLLSSTIGPHDDHRSACCKNHCLICLASSSLYVMRILICSVIFFSAALPAPLLAGEAVSSHADNRAVRTLISLKTKIIS